MRTRSEDKDKDSGGRSNLVVRYFQALVVLIFQRSPHCSTLAGTESACSPPNLGNAMFDMVSMTGIHSSEHNGIDFFSAVPTA